MKTRLALVLLFGWPLAFSTAQDQGIPPTDKKATTTDSRQDPGPAGLTRTDMKSFAKGARGSWSPDGKRIAVGKMPFGSGIVMVGVLDAASDSQSRIPQVLVLDIQPGAVLEFLPDGKDPAWSPDGKWIAFTREVGGDGNTTEEIWLTAGDKRAILWGVEEMERPVPGPLRRLGTGAMATWSADSTTVFFSNPQTREIRSIRVDKPDAEPVTVWKAVGDQFPDRWYPVVSPDGRCVAYHADGRLKIADMRVQEIVGSWPLDGWRGFLGGWSPDGSRLGYGAFGGEDKGLWELQFTFEEKPLSGGLRKGPAVLVQPRRILNDSCTLPSWSPDGSKLAFDSRSPQKGYEVWMVDAKRLSAAGESTTSEVVDPTVRVFRIRNAKAQDVVQEIRRVLPRGGLGADLRTNAIVVSGDGETLKIVEELIEKLDVAPPEPAAAAKPSERGEGAPTQTFQRASIGELEQAIAKLQCDLTLAEDKTREAAAAMQHAEQAEKAASGEAKTAALFRKLKAEVAAQREGHARARISSEFQAACRAYQEAIASSGTDDGTEPEDKPSVTAWPVAAFDGFDGRLDLPWKPIRHDPTHVSLDKHPGKLTIITERGSIHGDERHDEYGGGVQAKNIFVIDNPCSAETDFVMTTCIEGFTPQMPYQQAGLICYDDDDNYLKWGYEFCWPKEAGHTFTCVREIAAKSDFDVADAKPGITKYWLRIVKRGNKYQYAYSYDGEQYVVVGEQTWGDGRPKKLGLLAKNGGNPDASELECQFDFFQLQCPNEGKSINWDCRSTKTTDSSPASPTEEVSLVLTVYPLKHAEAEKTVQVLASIFAAQENCRIVADARTNGVVVFGTSEQQKKIQEAIRSLDVPAPGER